MKTTIMVASLVFTVVTTGCVADNDQPDDAEAEVDLQTTEQPFYEASCVNATVSAYPSPSGCAAGSSTSPTATYGEVGCVNAYVTRVNGLAAVSSVRAVIEDGVTLNQTDCANTVTTLRVFAGTVNGWTELAQASDQGGWSILGCDKPLAIRSVPSTIGGATVTAVKAIAQAYTGATKRKVKVLYLPSGC